MNEKLAPYVSQNQIVAAQSHYALEALDPTMVLAVGRKALPRVGPPSISKTSGRKQSTMGRRKLTAEPLKRARNFETDNSGLDSTDNYMEQTAVLNQTSAERFESDYRIPEKSNSTTKVTSRALRLRHASHIVQPQIA